jgi:hypothetical protein
METEIIETATETVVDLLVKEHDTVFEGLAGFYAKDRHFLHTPSTLDGVFRYDTLTNRGRAVKSLLRS